MPTLYLNHVLAALTPEDRAAFEPHLERVELEKGQVLTEQEHHLATVYFPETADLANVMAFEDGRAVETSTVGSEGVSGLAAVMARAPCAWRVVVQIAGTGWKLPAAVFRKQVDISTDLRDVILRLTHDYQSQAAQSAACNAIHEVTPRLARWLLLVQDRTDQTDISLTQGDLATLLGVQRTTINASAAELRAAGGIGYRRGRVQIKDRAVLRQMTCVCYQAQRRRSEALGITTRRQDGNGSA